MLGKEKPHEGTRLGGSNKTEGNYWKEKGLVRKEGFEPPRPFGHKILSLARLPVPPLPRGASILAGAASRFHRDIEDSRPTAGEGEFGRKALVLVEDKCGFGENPEA